jgi:hypothetical protein
MGDPELSEVRVEAGTELGTIVGEHARDGDSEAAQLAQHPIEEPGGELGVRRPDEDLADRPAGRGVDRGELPHRPHPFEFAEVEAVEGDQVTGARREVTEPEQSLQRRLGDQPAHGAVSCANAATRWRCREARDGTTTSAPRCG